MAATLEVEKDKTDALLRELLPATVAEDLRHGKTVEARTFLGLLYENCSSMLIVYYDFI